MFRRWMVDSRSWMVHRQPQPAEGHRLRPGAAAIDTQSIIDVQFWSAIAALSCLQIADVCVSDKWQLLAVAISIRSWPNCCLEITSSHLGCRLGYRLSWFGLSAGRNGGRRQPEVTADTALAS